MQAEVLSILNVKQCTGCREHKNHSEFGVSKSGRNGLNSRCKICHKTRLNANRRNRGGDKEISKKQRLMNRDVRLAREKEIRANNKERFREKHRKERIKYAERISKRDKKYRADAYFDKDKDIRLRLKNIKCRAKREGIPFSLNASDIIIPEYCPVLGIKLIKGNGMYAASVDRIDNTKGYMAGNIVVVSMLANRIKNSATPDQILSVGNFYKRLEESQI